MISLEQIRQLEARVHAAVAHIRELKSENASLKESLSEYELRIGELQEMVDAFKSDQDEIEKGIVAALAHLDGLEDEVARSATPDDSVPPQGESVDSTQRNPATESANDADTSMEVTLEEDGDAGEDQTPTVDLIESDEDEPELDIF